MDIFMSVEAVKVLNIILFFCRQSMVSPIAVTVELVKGYVHTTFKICTLKSLITSI